MSLNFTNRELTKTSDFLRNEIPEEQAYDPETIARFAHARDWLTSHEPVLRSFRAECHVRTRQLGLKNKSLVGTRLKRLKSVRRKLKAMGFMDLKRLQDIVGCRIVVENLNELNLVINDVKNRSRHKILKVNDYILEPKEDGYRSFHYVLAYSPSSEKYEHLANRRMELQIRTEIQHAWATSVEVAGLHLDKRLKGGEGPEDWRRYFILISKLLQNQEHGGRIHSVVESRRIADEFLSIEDRISGIDMLQAVSTAITIADTNVENSKNYQILIDRAEKSILVTGISSRIANFDEYARKETEDIMHGQKRYHETYVVARDIKQLKQSYPNYFADVKYLSEILSVWRSGLGVKTVVSNRREILKPVTEESAIIDPRHLNAAYGRKRKWAD